MSLPPVLNGLKEHDPKLYSLAQELNSLAFAPGALEEKTKVLITMALDALMGADQGVKVLAARARKAGATEEEIAEALRLAYLVAGMRTLITATAAFPGSQG
ncbi:MAG TPA: carboxymuconolactone decarboxylase family protein [Verrucomicrobiae bacterium]|nr:carboxymuconolactone decarboxylase family protein [Verrucomicrobiae bacterium]